MAGKGTVLIASGASGGHLFPALAVGEELARQGHAVKVVLGGGKFADVVERAGFDFVRLPAAAFNDRDVLRLAWAGVKLLRGFGRAFRLVAGERPCAVFGTGGYATVALITAARVLGVPTVIHEQNVLPGRANKLLARWADVVVLTFEESRRYLPAVRGRVVVGGMPLRKEVLQAARLKKTGSALFRLLVLGGSQGAKVLSEVVPAAVAMMSEEERKGLMVVQQVRPEHAGRVAEVYGGLGLGGFEVGSFFTDMPRRYGEADLLVGRSGVGTVLEAALLGLPAIYVPLELADGHQKLNAAVAEQAGAAAVVEQALFTPAHLLAQVRALRGDAGRLQAMAAAARGMAKPGAAAEVAKIVLDAAKV